MKNIYKVFISDWKRISKNVVAVVVVMGLIILPSLYAWFNILSNWDPYGEESTSRIKVAVASDDKGIVMDSLQFNMGDTIIEALESNNTIGWVFTDSTKDAIDGVYAGDYYAALVMPEDFSKKMVSFLTDSVTHPEIDYYTNQKKNAIAPKITDKAKTAVQQQVNSTFISTIAQTFVKAADGVDTSANHENMPSLTAVIVLFDASNETVAPSLAAASLISAMIADFWSAVREAISFTPLAVAVAASILAIT